MIVMHAHGLRNHDLDMRHVSPRREAEKKRMPLGVIRSAHQKNRPNNVDGKKHRADVICHLVPYQLLKATAILKRCRVDVEGDKEN